MKLHKHDDPSDWFVIKLNADAFGLKSDKIAYKGPNGGSYVVSITRAKLSIDETCRELGIGLYIPWERRKFFHKRSKKEISRDFPMFPGYAFVQNPNDFNKLLGAEGVSHIVSETPHGDPYRLSRGEMHAIMMAEKELWDKFWLQAPVRKGKKHRFRGKLQSNEAFSALKEIFGSNHSAKVAA